MSTGTIVTPTEKYAPGEHPFVDDEAVSEPRARHEVAEPQPMAAVVAGSTDDEARREAHQAHLDRWQRNYDANPEGFHRPGFCKHCGFKFGDRLEDKIFGTTTLIFPNVCCDPCAEKGRKRFELEARQAQDAKFAGIIPTEFMVWDNNKGNNDALAKARGAFSVSARKGVVLHGTTGSCKTRIMWQLVRHVVEQPEGFTWLVLDSYDLTGDKGIPKEAFNVHWLFIDDVGNEPKSTKFEMGLLRLLRARGDWHRPTTITTQLTPTAFRDRFFNGAAAEAIMRRFKERSAGIPTDRFPTT